ncbi:transcriptional regulator [Fervidicoccus fontis]|uniref:Putative transcription regulator, containing DNA-binding HTH domain n=1 Tax=Fervidicoccus fontis (strain DSM 19380 / JCM 18336 / VKM B-2539 / Kam940) TaxID=1163730 RepID=I0A249_FERFK|nr:transcriptional regulator [Fervidicoccus fontis]AFH43056.1 putative transcription regulator, containing DNA-binding HTH domain [Fervidicoccus fontis Kam940]
MISDFIIERISKEIAGEIAWSENPGEAMKKWRRIFNVTQLEISKKMGVFSSVLSDYEKGRRSPGSKFIRKFVISLLEIDEKRGWITVKELARNLRLPATALLDIREFTKEVTLEKVVEAINGEVLYGKDELNKYIYGYTVLDSIATIETLSGYEFLTIMGLTTERALIFTNVGTGRSPMVAVKVSFLKPRAVVVHGPKVVDPLTIKLAQSDGIPFILSRAPDVNTLIKNLKSLQG